MDGAPASAAAAAQEEYVPESILITGGCGFIASHVVNRLSERYPHYKIVVLDKMDYCASLKNIAPALKNPNVKFVKGDIQSMDLLKFILETERVDTIMHFAAQTHVDNSFGNSLAFTMNNTYGTHVLLEAARCARPLPPSDAGPPSGIRRFVNVSTDEVYGETSLGKEQGLQEHSVLEPTNPYSAAKAGAEMLCKAYLTSYRLPVIVTRGNNVYGPHQFPEKMIPKFTLLASRGKELPIHGDGMAVRSYLFVSDVAAAFDAVLHRGTTGETYNVGTDRERTVLDVAKDILKALDIDEIEEEGEEKKNKAAAGGENGGIGGNGGGGNGGGGKKASNNKAHKTARISHVRDRAFNDRRYYIGSDKLAALGWREETSWEEGLRRTIDWYLGTDGIETYWQGDLESALRPHPVLGAGGALTASGGGGDAPAAAAAFGRP